MCTPKIMSWGALYDPVGFFQASATLSRKNVWISGANNKSCWQEYVCRKKNQKKKLPLAGFELSTFACEPNSEGVNTCKASVYKNLNQITLTILSFYNFFCQCFMYVWCESVVTNMRDIVGIGMAEIESRDPIH